jgi:hypothetical protein
MAHPSGSGPKKPRSMNPPKFPSGARSRDYSGLGMPRGGSPFGDSEFGGGWGNQDKKLSKDVLNSLGMVSQDFRNFLENEKRVKEVRDDFRREAVAEGERVRLEKKTSKEIRVVLARIAKQTGLSTKEVAQDIDKKGTESHFYKEMRTESMSALKDSHRTLESFLKEKDNKLKTFLSSQLTKLDNFTSRNETLTRNTILGPLALLTAPFEDFFNSSILTAFKGIGNQFGKLIRKKKPSINDVLKKGDIGSVFLGNIMTRLLGKSTSSGTDDKKSIFARLFNKEKRKKQMLSAGTGPSALIGPEQSGGVSGFSKMLSSLKPKPFKKKNASVQDVALAGEVGAIYTVSWLKRLLGKDGGQQEVENPLDKFKNLMKGGGAGMGSFLMKALPIAAIVAGIGLMLVDGFKALASGWGTSKVSTFIGGMLGGTSSGMEGAFKNMGKWALIGAGIGTLAIPVPIVGTLIGGLLGAAVGGILGFIGGEKIAGGLDAIGKWFNETFDLHAILMATPIGAIINFIDKQKANWKSDKPIEEKLGNTFKDILVLVKDLLLSPFKLLGTFLNGTAFKKKINIKEISTTVGDFLSKFIKGFVKGMGLPTGVGDFLGGIVNSVVQMVGNVLSFFTDQLKNIGDLLTGKKSIGDFITDFIGGTFKMLGDNIRIFLKENPIGKFIDNHLIRPFTQAFQAIGDFFGYLGSKNIIDIIKDFGSGSFGSNLSSYAQLQNETRMNKSEEFSTFKKNAGLYMNKEGVFADEVWQNASQADKLTFYERLMSLTGEQQRLIADKYSKGSKTTKLNILNSQDPISVKDAILRPNGQIIHTDPSDTIIATKNDPMMEASYSIKDSLITLPKNRDKFSDTFTERETNGSVFSTSSMENKLDVMISVLKEILTKEPYKVTLPPSTSRDMDLIMNGGIL